MFKDLAYIIPVIILFLLACSKVNAQVDTSSIGTQPAHIYREDFSNKDLTNKSYRFRNYKLMGKEYKTLCKLLHTDGRRELFIKVLQVHSKIKRDDCKACKPFYKVFAKACRKSKEKKKSRRKKKKDVPAEKEITVYPQREPSLTVVNYIITLFSKLAQFEKNSRATYIAVKDLIAKLSDKEGKTPGELEYISHIKNYFLTPFDKLLEEEENIAKAKNNKSLSERRWKVAD